MRGWLIVLMVVVLSTIVFAQAPTICSDTDKGGSKGTDAALKEKGEVKYGLTTQVDTCLTSENGVSTAESMFLKEYFCQDDERKSDVYDCDKRGYEKCKDGACIGGSSSSSTGTNATPRPVSACGNKIVEKDKGEQCDPPNGVCFGKSSAEYGTCQADCICKISEAALKNMREQPAVCGDGYKHPDEDCEDDSDCTIASYICSSCKCVKELTSEEIEAMKAAALAKKEEKKEEMAKEIEEEYKTPELTEVDLTSKNFSEEPGMKATSGIANFFKKIFGWLASIFS